MSLRSSLQSDLLLLMQKFQTDIAPLADSVMHIETKLGDLTSTVNDLVEAQDENIEERMWIKNKLADLEDRSLYNKVKIRGLSESMQALE